LSTLPAAVLSGVAKATTASTRSTAVAGLVTSVPHRPRGADNRCAARFTARSPRHAHSTTSGIATSNTCATCQVSKRPSAFSPYSATKPAAASATQSSGCQLPRRQNRLAALQAVRRTATMPAAKKQ
jgi:hypothetical protein